MMKSMERNDLDLGECKNFEATSVLLKLMKSNLEDNATIQIRYIRIDNECMVNGCGIWVGFCSIEKDVKTDVVVDHVL